MPRKKNDSRISINKFEEAVARDYNPITAVEWKGLQIEIKRELSAPEMLKFVDVVVNACFKKETGEYTPQSKDFAIKDCIIELYSNVSLPTNLLKRYEIIYKSGFADFVTGYINNAQLESIIEAANEIIRVRVQANVDNLSEQVSNVCSALADFQENISNAFDGVNINDFQKLASVIGDNNVINVPSLVKALSSGDSEDE